MFSNHKRRKHSKFFYLTSGFFAVGCAHDSSSKVMYPRSDHCADVDTVSTRFICGEYEKRSVDNRFQQNVPQPPILRALDTDKCLKSTSVILISVKTPIYYCFIFKCLANVQAS